MQAVEFETVADDNVRHTGRRRVIILAIARHQPENSHIFTFIYDLLKLPVDEAFHASEGDYKAISIATGNFSQGVLCF